MKRPRRQIGSRFVAWVRGAFVRHGESRPPVKAIGTSGRSAAAYLADRAGTMAAHLVA